MEGFGTYFAVHPMGHHWVDKRRRRRGKLSSQNTSIDRIPGFFSKTKVEKKVEERWEKEGEKSLVLDVINIREDFREGGKNGYFMEVNRFEHEKENTFWRGDMGEKILSMERKYLQWREHIREKERESILNGVRQRELDVPRSRPEEFCLWLS